MLQFICSYCKSPTTFPAQPPQETRCKICGSIPKDWSLRDEKTVEIPFPTEYPVLQIDSSSRNCGIILPISLNCEQMERGMQFLLTIKGQNHTLALPGGLQPGVQLAFTLDNGEKIRVQIQLKDNPLSSGPQVQPIEETNSRNVSAQKRHAHHIAFILAFVVIVFLCIIITITTGGVALVPCIIALPILYVHWFGDHS